MTLIFDAHVHLSDDEYKGEIGFILYSMERLGIKACSVSMDNKSSQITLDLAKKSKTVLPFIGIHPEKVNDDLESMIQLIHQNSGNIAGIGEIGLDKTYVADEEGFKRQKEVFTRLLGEAERIKKPVSVHSRRTLDEVLSIIPSYDIHGFLLHWFDGNKSQLKKAMDLDCFVSYGPLSVYSHDKQTLISITDKDRILVETDGPVKFSHCFGMKPAQPSFIPSVIFCVSKIFETSYDECASILETNSKNYLQI